MWGSGAMAMVMDDVATFGGAVQCRVAAHLAAVMAALQSLHQGRLPAELCMRILLEEGTTWRVPLHGQQSHAGAAPPARSAGGSSAAACTSSRLGPHAEQLCRCAFRFPHRARSRATAGGGSGEGTDSGDDSSGWETTDDDGDGDGDGDDVGAGASDTGGGSGAPTPAQPTSPALLFRVARRPDTATAAGSGPAASAAVSVAVCSVCLGATRATCAPRVALGNGSVWQFPRVEVYLHADAGSAWAPPRVGFGSCAPLNPECCGHLRRWAGDGFGLGSSESESEADDRAPPRRRRHPPCRHFHAEGGGAVAVRHRMSGCVGQWPSTRRCSCCFRAAHAQQLAAASVRVSVPTACRPRADQAPPTVCRPCSSHALVMCWPCAGRVLTMR